MNDWANINLNSSNSDENEDSPNIWGSEDDFPDDWMDAPDPEEVAIKKKEEEERIRKEKEEAIEAEKKRKQAIREEKIRKKKLLFDNEDASNYDDNLFEVTKEQKEIADFHNALDAFGELDMNKADTDKIDIGTYNPDTVAQFNAFAIAIESKIKQIFPEILRYNKKKNEYEQLKSIQNNNIVKMIEYLITALCDNYKSAFLEDLYKHMNDLYNKKLDESKKIQGYKKKTKQQKGAFFNADKSNDFDDSSI